MSSSRMVFDGRKQAGRSNFVQTCNLLSRYIKENGSLRDLNLEIGGKVESLESIVKPGSSTNLAHPSMEQQPPPFSSINNQPFSKEDPKASQLTIFYSGKVLVFDNYPYSKAQDLIAYAERERERERERESSPISCGILPNISSSREEGLPPRPQPTTCSSTTEANASDLPIARRSSLHRFLEKRKDRAVARGPYHQNQAQQHQGSSSSSKGDEQLELRL